MPRLPARLPAPATVAHQIAGYWSVDHRSRRGDEDQQHCYSRSWRIALLVRFWQARHPPRYAAYLTPSSPRFPHSSCRSMKVRMREQVSVLVNRAALHRHSVPDGGNGLVEPRRAVDDEKLGPPQPALDEIVEDSAPGLG